jgi:hypothetical protein
MIFSIYMLPPTVYFLSILLIFTVFGRYQEVQIGTTQ